MKKLPNWKMKIRYSDTPYLMYTVQIPYTMMPCQNGYGPIYFTLATEELAIFSTNMLTEKNPKSNFEQIS